MSVATGPADFRDLFSGHADLYAAARPAYPAALFEWLAGLVAPRRLAWDCATGNGQAAMGLARWFDAVVATDASEGQLAHATPHPAIEYRLALADRSGLAAGSVDLVTIAQALHWLDLPAFYAEVRRVGRPGGVLAAWCYVLPEVDGGVDAVVHHIYRDVVGPYWTPERRLVEEGYRTVPFPFDEVTPPAFRIVEPWDLGRLLRYIESWSAVQRYRNERGDDPLAPVRPALEAAWGDPSQPREVAWPVHLRAGRLGAGR